MGFWIFMLIMDLLIPISMLIFGRLFMKKAPTDINYVFGYRTTMSMKNKDTWDFAHKYIGKIWYAGGLLFAAITIIVMLPFLGGDEDVVGTVGGIVCSIQLIPMIGAVIPTEMALRKNFTKDGKRK